MTSFNFGDEISFKRSITSGPVTLTATSNVMDLSAASFFIADVSGGSFSISSFTNGTNGQMVYLVGNATLTNYVNIIHSAASGGIILSEATTTIFYSPFSILFVCYNNNLYGIGERSINIGIVADTANINIGINGARGILIGSSSSTINMYVPYLQMQRTAAHNVDSGVVTTVYFDVELFNRQFTTPTSGTIAIPQDGLYYITADLYFNGGGSGGYTAYIYSSRQPTFDFGKTQIVSSSGSVGLMTSHVLNLRSTDTIEIRVYQSTGSSVNLAGGASSTYCELSIVKVGAAV